MNPIIPVWRYNLVDELKCIDSLLHFHGVVYVDTEFPGFLIDTPRQASESLIYSNLKFNVDATTLIQLGLTLSDENGNIAGCWEFNFSFDAQTEVYTDDSLEFLKDHGINFEKLKNDGIDIRFFSDAFVHILAKHRNLKWITFHGLYDMAHMVTMVTKSSLPPSSLDFTELIANVFGCYVFDIKYIATFCDGLSKGELGLEKLAKILRVKRVGGAHQAGSDSLLSATVFSRLKTVYGIDESRHVGFLYGIGNRIRKSVRPRVLYPSLLVTVSRRFIIPCWLLHHFFILLFCTLFARM
ncbi:putative CCR4-associated factor 1 homolog 8 [Jatropha curcas]|uniref:putative CCR4-associated factor 1 homolog 8 n=1 Tax=Jatropha curcas TaxID=180498 RepID=UPI00189480DF|nr:putative CCR4-associated factor 1 homolog 8 [Jatropha curcas]XP_037491797.1 putative CCR4-associated factor 1 homolog 8 [Jatropha curcas]